MSDLLAATSALVRTLEQSRLSYAIGGALAFGAWAVPRATMDIDLNIWFGSNETNRTALSHLYALGVSGPEIGIAEQQANDTGVVFCRWETFRLDVFVPSIPFYAEALRTRVRLNLRDIGECWILSAESIAVFKLLFFRNKDLADLERLFAIQGKGIDREYIRAQLVDMVSDTDERVRFLDALA